MNKTKIKNFAISARVNLIESVKQRAFYYGITEDTELSAIGYQLSANTEQRKALIEQIRQKGYTQVMEEAAYTWFNRFIALRFMEVNGYLPSKVRVFTDETGAFKPEIMKQAMSVEIDGLDRARVLDLLDRQDNEELYKYLLITQCNALNVGLPYMFEKIANWTELLFPTNLLRPDSVIGQMIGEIPEEDWTDAVQIIGWLYQYYNSELKDETFALLKKNVKITKERIPAATQLFTPDWIVRYMVENSLGRIFIADSGKQIADSTEAERIENEKAIAEKMGWKYYLPEAEQTPEVRQQLSAIGYQLSADRLTSLKLIDPCMGSGHILVYAFDVLMQIYTSAGWSERDAAKSILENNLYGLDIDDRAGQLAYFAVMMKARKYNRRILNGETAPNLLSIQDSNWMTDEFIAYVAGKNEKIKADLVLLRKTFRDAKEYGSILTVPALDFEALYARISEIGESAAENLFDADHRLHTKDLLLPLVRQARILAQKYDVVVTNPPYMGASGMSAKLSEFVKKYYPDSKSDLFAVFIERCGDMLKPNGYQAMITQHAWMFLSSFEKLRGKLFYKDIVNMAHLGARAFEEIGGEVVQTTSFVLKNSAVENYLGTYCRLIEPTTQQGKEDMFLAGENRYTANQSNFSKIPGTPVAYWVSEKLYNCYIHKNIYKYANPCKGIDTGDNSIFLRFWYEVYNTRLFIPNGRRLLKLDFNNNKWFPYNKGGDYRKWYGNNEYVINWENDGFLLQHFKGSNLRNKDRYFSEGITWSTVSSNNSSFRFFSFGFLFDNGGSCLFSNEKLLYIHGFLNSCVAKELLNIQPTINNQPGTIGKLPLILSDLENHVNDLVWKNIENAKKDWDSYETSWDFKKHPLI